MSNSSFSYNLGVLAGIIFGIILVAIIWKVVYKKKLGEKEEYDERQELLKNRGYKYAYFTSLIGMFLVMIIKSGFRFGIEISYCFLICTVLFISLAVYVVYCVMNDAYFSLTSNRRRFLILMILLSVINVMSGLLAIYRGYADIHAESLAGWANFECGLLFLVVGIAMFIKSRMEKKEEEE